MPDQTPCALPCAAASSPQTVASLVASFASSFRRLNGSSCAGYTGQAGAPKGVSMNKGIKKLEANTYRVRVTHTCPRTGKRRDWARKVVGLQEARRVQAEMLQAMQRGQGSRGRIPLKDWLAYWWKRHEVEWKYSTKVRRAQLIDAVALTKWGKMPLDFIAPSDVEDLLRHLHEVRGWGGHSCRQVLEVLRTATKDAIKHRAIDRWPCEGAKNPIRITGSRRALSAEEASRLLDACEGEWGCMTWVSLLTGLRWCEVSALEWGDYDGQTLHVQRAQVRGRFGTTKTGKTRRVPVHPLLAAKLAQLPQESRLMFPGRNDGPRDYKAAWKHLRDACVRAGLEPISWHELRHTANDLLRRVAAGDVVRAITGHSTASMTEHYSHVDQREKGVAMDRVVESLNVGVGVGLRSVGGECMNHPAPISTVTLSS